MKRNGLLSVGRRDRGSGDFVARHGATMLEMMVVMAVGVAFMSVCMVSLQGLLRTRQRQQDALHRDAVLQRLMIRFREDVWAADAVSTTDAEEVTLENSVSTVSWRIFDRQIERRSADAVQRFNFPPRTVISFGEANVSVAAMIVRTNAAPDNTSRKVERRIEVQPGRRLPLGELP